MSQELIASSQPLPTLSSRGVWLSALMRPSVAIYNVLGLQPRASLWRAYMWMFAAGLIGGAIDSLSPFVSQVVERSYVDTLLLALIPVSSIIAVFFLAAFTGCVQGLARLFRGSGTYKRLAYVYAAFSAPLLIVASILDLIPQTRFLLVVLYFYWIALYVVGLRAVNELSRAKAIAAVFLALLIVGLVWLGGAFLVGYWGLLLP
jgi:hypothetical protein